MHTTLADLGLDQFGLLTTLFIPVDQYPAMQTLLSLLFQLLRETLEFAMAMNSKTAQLIKGDDVVYPFRVLQQALKMIHLLLHTCAGTLVLLDAILQFVLLIAQRRALLLEFGTIPIKIQKLVAILGLYGI